MLAWFGLISSEAPSTFMDIRIRIFNCTQAFDESAPRYSRSCDDVYERIDVDANALLSTFGFRLTFRNVIVDVNY